MKKDVFSLYLREISVIRDDVFRKGPRCWEAIFFYKVGSNREFSANCCSFLSCHMARMVVLDFIWYWAMIGKVEKFVFTLPIHTPHKGVIEISPQVCTLGMPSCVRVMDVPERYWINLGKFADFQQTVTSFRHVSSQEKSFWFHSSYHCNEGDLAGIERYWGKMKIISLM